MPEVPLTIKVKIEELPPWRLRWSKDARERWDCGPQSDSNSVLLSDTLIERVLKRWPGACVISHRAVACELSVVVFEHDFETYEETRVFRDALVTESDGDDSGVLGCVTAEIISARRIYSDIDTAVRRHMNQYNDRLLRYDEPKNHEERRRG